MRQQHSIAPTIYLAGLFAIIISMIIGCSKHTGDIIDPPAENSSTTVTTVYGRVVDEQGKAISAVSITIGTQNTITDEHGLFIIKDIRVPKDRVLVLAKKMGYFISSKAAVAGESATTRVELSMMSDNTEYYVSSSDGGKITILGSSGASISFQPESFLTTSGSPYHGTVSIAAKYLDPASASFSTCFSGDNMGQASDGKNVRLASCGVVRAELTGSVGERLVLDPSKPATITYPKTSDVSAPASMPLWYFDEALGLWKQEGTAALSGNSYTGTITHFSDWNLDYPIDWGDVELRVLCGTTPVSGVAVTVFQFTGYTGPDGRLRIVGVPANRDLQLQINADNNNGLYYLNIPVSFSVQSGQTATLGDITLNSPCPAIVNGKVVDCNTAPVTAMLFFTDGIYSTYHYSASGVFSATIASNKALIMTASDVNGNTSVPATIQSLGSGESRDLAPIVLCASTADKYVEVKLDSPASSLLYYYIALSPDGSRLAVSTIENNIPKVFIYDTKDGQRRSTITLESDQYVGEMNMSVDNNTILCHAYPKALIYDISGSTGILRTWTYCDHGYLSDDASKMIVWIYDESITDSSFRVYSAINGSLIKTMHVPVPLAGGGRHLAGAFGYNHEEGTIIFGDMDDTHPSFTTWDLSSAEEIRKVPKETNSANCFFSEDGTTLGISADGTMYNYYDTKSFEKVNTLTPVPGSAMMPVVTKHYAYSLLQVDNGYIIQTINIANGTVSSRPWPSDMDVSELKISRSEKYMAVSGSGKIRIWKLQ